jgi:hypothetical protein
MRLAWVVLLAVTAGAQVFPVVQDTEPFLLIGGPSVLNGTAQPDDGFGPEDKLVSCNANLVFVDLDASSSLTLDNNEGGRNATALCLH